MVAELASDTLHQTSPCPSNPVTLDSTDAKTTGRGNRLERLLHVLLVDMTDLEPWNSREAQVSRTNFALVDLTDRAPWFNGVFLFIGQF